MATVSQVRNWNLAVTVMIRPQNAKAYEQQLISTNKGLEQKVAQWYPRSNWNERERVVTIGREALQATAAASAEPVPESKDPTLSKETCSATSPQETDELDSWVGPFLAKSEQLFEYAPLRPDL